MSVDNRYVIVMAALMLVAISGWITSLSPGDRYVTGAATTASAPSSAVIQKYLAITASDNLSAIDFGNINQLPATDVNASKNWDDMSGGSDNNETLYWIEVASDSNTNVDFCIKADAFNTSSGDEIELGNYTWNDSTTNDENSPSLPGTAITTSYAAGQTAVGPGSNNYYRFWLDVPISQAAGTYNNTVTFLGQPQGTACP